MKSWTVLSFLPTSRSVGPAIARIRVKRISQKFGVFPSHLQCIAELNPKRMAVCAGIWSKSLEEIIEEKSYFSLVIGQIRVTWTWQFVFFFVHTRRQNARNEAVKLCSCLISNLYFSLPIFTLISFFSISKLRFVLTIFAAVESKDSQSILLHFLHFSSKMFTL